MAYMINGASADLPNPEDVGGITFVPMAKIVEMLGGYITWDNASKTASIELGSTKAEVQADSDSVTVGGNTVTLSSRPSMGGGSLWVPLDLFTDVLGCTATSDGTNVMVSTT